MRSLSYLFNCKAVPIETPLLRVALLNQVVGLQEQLDKGPSAQLTRLQQENTILRDALNQATSQAESK